MPAPNDPNSSELQRDQPAIEPGPTPVEESAAFSMEEVISEIIPNPETVSAIIEFLNQEQLEPEDVEVTAGMWGWDESADIATIKHGTKEFFVAPDWETCKSMALALVKNDLDNEPDILAPTSWKHISMLTACATRLCPMLRSTSVMPPTPTTWT